MASVRLLQQCNLGHPYAGSPLSNIRSLLRWTHLNYQTHFKSSYFFRRWVDLEFWYQCQRQCNWFGRHFISSPVNKFHRLQQIDKDILINFHADKAFTHQDWAVVHYKGFDAATSAGLSGWCGVRDVNKILQCKWYCPFLERLGSCQLSTHFYGFLLERSEREAKPLRHQHWKMQRHFLYFPVPLSSQNFSFKA